MNDRVEALKEFQKITRSQKDDRNYMSSLYLRIFEFKRRYAFGDAIDYYVDIEHFIEDGVERIKNGCDTWYKKDFIKAGLIKNTIKIE